MTSQAEIVGVILQAIGRVDALVLAAESAFFGLAFVNIGLVPDGGSGSQRAASPSTWAYTDNPIIMVENILRGLPLDECGVELPFEAERHRQITGIVPVTAAPISPSTYNPAPRMGESPTRPGNL